MALQLDWPYYVDSMAARVLTFNGGSSVCSGGTLSLTCAAAPSSAAVLQGTFPLVATGGADSSADFTASFDSSPAPGTVQMVGLGDGEQGAFFGYNGTDFGVRMLSMGQTQIYAFSVSTAATAAGQVRLTLNGTAFQYPVTKGQAPLALLQQVAGDPLLGAANMVATLVNSTVLIATSQAQPAASAPVLTDSGTGCQCGLTTLVTGSNPTSVWIRQQDWQGSLAGRPSPVQWSNGNTFRIAFSTVGFGTITYSVLDPVRLEFVAVHTLTRANSQQNLAAFMQGLFPSIYSRNLTGTSAVTVSSTGFLLSPRVQRASARPPFCYSATLLNLPVTLAPVTVLSVQNMLVVNGQRNRRTASMKSLVASVTCNQPCQLSCYKNPVLSLPLAGGRVDGNAIVQADSSTQAAVTGGSLLSTWTLMNSNLVTFDVSNLVLEPGAVLCFAVTGAYAVTTGLLTPAPSVTATLGLTITWTQP